jgi:hypothetical protein
MYFENFDGDYIYSPSVSGLGGIMQPHNPMLSAVYKMSPLLPSDMFTPTTDMTVGMPDRDETLSGMQFNDPALCGFGSVQDAISTLSIVDLLSRA